MLTENQAKRGAIVHYCFYADLTGNEIVRWKARITGLRQVTGAYANLKTRGVQVELLEGDGVLKGLMMDVRADDTAITEGIWLEPLDGENPFSLPEPLCPGFELMWQKSVTDGRLRAIARRVNGGILFRGPVVNADMQEVRKSRAAVLQAFSAAGFGRAWKP